MLPSSSPGGAPPALAARCRVGASQSSLLITEWPAAEKANLDALLRRGGVAVEFSGCAMRLLPECQLPGGYIWQRTTTATDVLEIDDQSELYAKLPLGALSLEGELQQSGTLYIETTVVGQARLQDATPQDVPRTYECERATHIVDGMTVGAFVLSAAAREGVGGSVGVERLGTVGQKQSRAVKVIRYAGQSEACNDSTDEGPASDCSSPIQVFLTPIPGRAEEVGAPGTVKVDFESASESVRWDVYVDDEATCTTPCDRWVDPNRPVALRTREDHPSKLRIHGLEGADGPLQVTAYPTSRGKLSTGITFTSLGGLSLITGITLAAVGCGGQNDGMCLAGVINIGAGGLVTLGAIWLMLDALPRYRVAPLFNAGSLRSVQVGPGFVAGKF